MQKKHESWIMMKRREREYYQYTDRKKHWKYKWIVKWILVLLATVIGFAIGLLT